MLGNHLIVETIVIICSSIAIAAAYIGSVYMTGPLSIFTVSLAGTDILIVLAIIARWLCRRNLDRFTWAGVAR